MEIQINKNDTTSAVVPVRIFSPVLGFRCDQLCIIRTPVRSAMHPSTMFRVVNGGVLAVSGLRGGSFPERQIQFGEFFDQNPRHGRISGSRQVDHILDKIGRLRRHFKIYQDGAPRSGDFAG